jgi:hypothetical protein
VPKCPKRKKGGTAPKNVVAHSFAEESVTESSGGEKEAMVSMDARPDVISHVI